MLALTWGAMITLTFCAGQTFVVLRCGRRREKTEGSSCRAEIIFFRVRSGLMLLGRLAVICRRVFDTPLRGYSVRTGGGMGMGMGMGMGGGRRAQALIIENRSD